MTTTRSALAEALRKYKETNYSEDQAMQVSTLAKEFYSRPRPPQPHRPNQPLVKIGRHRETPTRSRCPSRLGYYDGTLFDDPEDIMPSTGASSTWCFSGKVACGAFETVELDI
uniref:Uncharacterized protein n=1 Tax=viral metagenome TaxID=1070528 RepID=A0A6C0BNL9_9ZZZZ